MLENYLTSAGVAYDVVDMYDTVPTSEAEVETVPASSVDEIVFTSPSTVDAWLTRHGGKMPPRDKCAALGDVTDKYIDAKIAESQ